MITEILATGDEIRTGALVDTNSGYIAEKLEEAGIAVARHSCVGDDRDALISIFREMGERADAVVATGGLGPTTDDLTAEAAAAAAGVDLEENARALAGVEAFFAARGRPVTASNRKQAFLPRGADMLDNPVGTAPGFAMQIGRCTFFFLPGVPPEMRRMLENHVLPRLRRLQGDVRQHCMVKTITTFGLTESVAGEKVAAVTREFPRVKLGLRARFPEIHVKLYLNGTDQPAMERLLDAAVSWTTAQLGKSVLSTEGASMPAVVGGLLRSQRATLAVAESCTGGRIANWLTDVSGSSDYFLLSAVTYANAMKTDLLGVSPRTLELHGAVHEETAREMAAGARRIAGADYAIATTGIAGPSGGSAEKPVGTVCIGLATPDKALGRRYCFPFNHRGMNKSMFAMTALNLLRRALTPEGN